MKKATLIVVTVFFIAPIVIYFVFPEFLYDFFLWSNRKAAGLEKKVVKIEGHEIVYLEGGTGDTILLIHGFTADKDNWTQLAKSLTLEFHVVALDLPGFGESTKLQECSYTIAQQVSYLNQFVNELKLTQFHLAGNSMGGTISGRFAVRFPEKVLSLGLFDTGGVYSCEKSELAKRIEKGENPLLVETPEQFDKMLAFVFEKPPEIPNPIKRFLSEKAMDAVTFNEKILKDLFAEKYILEKDLSKIRVRTLILWGDMDRVIDVSCIKILEKKIGKSKTVIMKNCGHIPMLERPEETAQHYIAFLKK